MKKIIIGVLLIFSGLIGYSQIPDITPPVLFQNQQSYGAIRGIINTNANNFRNYVNRLKDTLNIHNTRLMYLETNGTGTGTGTSYVFNNGVRVNGPNVELGGSLISPTTLNTTGNNFSILSSGSIPVIGSYANFLFKDIGLTLSSLSNGIYDNSESTLELPSTGFFKLTGKVNTDNYSTIYQNALGLHFFYTGNPMSSEIVSMNGSGGLKYGGNYSTEFTDNSLVTKQYVLSVLGTGGSGTVTVSGTPVLGQLAVFGSATSLTGSNLIMKNPYGGLQLSTPTGISLIVNAQTGTTGIDIQYSGNTTTGLNISNASSQILSTVGDSIFFHKYADWTVRPWNTFSSTGALDTAHTSNAGERLTAKIRPLVFHLYDRKIINGVSEISFYHSNGKKEYGIQQLDPWVQVEALMGGIEMAYRYIFRTQILVFVLLLIIVFLGRFIYKLNKRILILEKKI